MQLSELDCIEGRAGKNRCLQTVVLEKSPESFLNSREIKPINLKGNPPWILIRRTDAEAEAPVFCSSDTNSWLIGKDPDAGKDWGQKVKRVSEDEIDGLMASPMQLIWTWANFRRWWGKGRPEVLQCMGSQILGHDWVTEQQHTLNKTNRRIRIIIYSLKLCRKSLLAVVPRELYLLFQLL